MIVAWRRPAHILVAAQPKAGSTFLATAIAGLPGFKKVQLVPGHGRREQELSEWRLGRYRWRRYVAQHHVRRSAVTDDMIRRHGLTVVVLIRNLFDVAVSLRDHLRNESVVLPMAFFTEQHRKLPDAELEAMIVRLAMPWYVNFYMSWRGCPGVMVLRYEDLIDDPAGRLKAIAKAAGLVIADAKIERALSHAGGARLNVGIKGRGASLANCLKREITDSLAFYPEAVGDEYVRDMLDDR